MTDLHIGSPNIVWPTVPFGGLRLWDTGTGWSQINSSQGHFDFAQLDAFAQDAQMNGADLLYNLARTPTWASSDPSDSSCAYDVSGEGGAGQCDPPNDLNADGSGTNQHWIDWVTAIAQHNATSSYAHIKYYEIWNEWNIALFWNYNNGATPAQLVRMEQDARCIIEGPPSGLKCNSNSTFPSGTALDPGAKIITPSPVGAGYPSNNLSAVADKMATYFTTSVTSSNGTYNGGQFADILGFHGYVGTPKGQDVCPIPENVTTVLGDLEATVTSNTTESYSGGVPKPWFNTEAGWSQAPFEDFTDPDRQDAFLPRYMLLQWSMGVDRMYWYRWDATSTYGGALWTASAGPIEAVTAWDEVSKWMVGASVSGPCQPVSSGSTVWSCTITRSGNYKALAVWDAGQDCLNGSCTTSTFTIPSGGYTMVRDIAGNQTGVSGSSTPIGAKPVLLETSALP
jgi:hypothetical protein